MTNNDTHDRLVRWLIKKLKEKGYDKFYADLPDYNKPAKVGRHVPDISAYKNGKKAALGEAKTCDDLSSERTKEQFKDFSKNPKLHLYIVVPDGCVDEAKKVAKKLGIYPKSNVTIW